MIDLQGIIPILSMPFHDDDAIDFASLVDQAEFLIGTGAIGIGFGFGSEIFRLTDAERDQALAAVCRRVGDRLPVVAPAGANSTHACIARSLAAREAGAAVLMITPPAMSSAGPDEIVAHYSAVAEQVGLPIIVQDAPSMSGVVMSDDVMGRLAAEIELVVSIKVESLPTAPKVASVAAKVGTNALVLGGAGGQDFVHELERGARGTIPGAALPEVFVFTWRAFQNGDRALARRFFHRFLPLWNLSARSMDTFLFVQKEILRRRGVLPNARLRTPSERIDPTTIRELEVVLAELDLANLGRSWDIPPDGNLAN